MRHEFRSRRAAAVVFRSIPIALLRLGAYVTRDVEVVREILADDFAGQLGDVLADGRWVCITGQSAALTPPL